MQFGQLKRREFIAVLGAAVTAPPIAARAQQPAMPVIGFLHAGSPEPNADLVSAFRKGLAQTGYVEGQNMRIDFRWAGGQDHRLPELAKELVRERVAVIATPGTTQASLAAKNATAAIPIVFVAGADPVALGLVSSLNRPGGNATGICFISADLAAKRLGLLHDLVPAAARFVALVNPAGPLSEASKNDLEAGAKALGLKVDILHASSSREIDAAFAELASKPGSALIVNPDAFFTNRRSQLVTLAARYTTPAIFSVREFATIGGLMSYGPNFADAFHQVGVYTGRVLNGEKPTDLPVLQPTKFEYVINLQTAKLLGLTFPPGLLAIADEVIE